MKRTLLASTMAAAILGAAALEGNDLGYGKNDRYDLIY